MSQTVDQSIIIPTDGDTLRLRWALAGIERQQTDSGFEVIVVADCTDAQMQELAKLAFTDTGLNIRAVSLPVKTEEDMFRAGSARNLGIRHARGQQVVFLDQDCVPDADWLATHWTGRDGLTIGLRRDLPERHVEEYPGVIDDMLFGMYANFDGRYGFEQPDPGMWASCNASAPRDLLREIGGFDETLDGVWGGEDMQLACRVRSRGGVGLVMFKEGGWVTHLNHGRRPKRPDNKEFAYKCLRGEFPVVANGGPLEPAEV